MPAKAANTFPENRLALSIQETAKTLASSEWQVKQALRQGLLRARKVGARTLVEADSVKTYWDKLPAARFAPTVDRKAARETRKEEENVT
jgi:hypothetical protein